MKINKKGLIGVLFILVTLTSLANANATLPSIFANTQAKASYWHSSDGYVIELNSVGDAFVGEQISLESLSMYGTNSILLEIPYAEVTVYKLVEMVNTDYYCPPGTYCTTTDVYPYPGASSQFVNYTTSTTGSSTLINIYLNQPLTNSSVKTLYLFFSARNVAEKTFQGYEFSFKTVIDRKTLIREAYANVEVPQDMYIKGKASTYSYSYSMGEALSATTAVDVASAARSLFRYPGQYQYQTSNLLPGEYFLVGGLYGSSTILLYLPEILAVILLVVAVALLLKFLLLPKLNGLRSILVVNKNKKSSFSFLRVLLVSAASGFLFLVAFFLMLIVYGAISYGYYYSSSPLPLLFVLLGVVICGIALFGLPYYLYANFSKKEGFAAGVLSIVAAIVFLILLIYFFYLFQPVVY